MITHFEEQQLEKLKEIASKKTAIQQLKDKCRANQMSLKRDRNRFQAIDNLFHSDKYQQLLKCTIQSFHQFQIIKKEYSSLPESNTIKLQKLQLANQNMEASVLDLEFNIQREKQRQNRINQCLQTCEQAVDALLHKKQQVEAEICTLKNKLAKSQQLNTQVINQLTNQTVFSEQDLQLLEQQSYQKLQFKYSQQIKNANMLQSHLLLQLADKYNLLHQLQHQHDSAQRLFSHYSKCQSEHDLIAEQENLIQQIKAVTQQIQKEEQHQRKILNDCEYNVRSEAVAQAHAWIKNRLQDIEKKKNTIRALLQIIVPSQENAHEIEGIQSEMKTLLEQQARLRQRLSN